MIQIQPYNHINIISHTDTHTLSTHSSTVNVVLVRRVSASARTPSGPMLLALRLVGEGVGV